MCLRKGPCHRAALGGRERGRGKIDADILYAAAVQPLVLAPQVVQHTQIERAAVVKFVRQDGDALHPAEQCGIALQNIAAEGDLDQRADRKLTVVEQLAKLRLIVLERKLARVERINVAPLAVHIREQQRVALTDRDHAAARDCAFCFGRRLLIAAVRRRRAGRLPRAAREQGAEQGEGKQKGKTSFHGRYLLEWFLLP